MNDLSRVSEGFSCLVLSFHYFLAISLFPFSFRAVALELLNFMR